MTSHWLDDIGYVGDAIDCFYIRMASIQHVSDYGLIRDGAAVNSREEIERSLRSQEIKDTVNRAGVLIQKWLDTDVPEIRNLLSHYWPKRYANNQERIQRASNYLDQRVGALNQNMDAIREFSLRLNEGADPELLLKSGFQLALDLSFSKAQLSSVSHEVVKALKLVRRENQWEQLRR